MKKIFKVIFLDLLKTIENKENEDYDDCLKCENYLPFGDDGKCDIYGIPNHGISHCNDFTLSDFWVTKRGY